MAIASRAVGRGEIAAATLLVLGALLACGAATDEQLQTRAAFDLDCKASELHIVELDGETRGVSGCGQRVTYVQSCDAPPSNMARSCTWVLNGSSKRSHE